MGSFKTFAAAGVMSLAFATGSASAADLLSAQQPMMPVAPVPVDVGGGWYLRGDVGVSAYNRPHLSSPDAPPAVFYGEELGSGAFAGVGVGYQFSRWFRADVTGEYRFASQLKAFDKVSFPAGSDGTPGTILNEITEGKYSASVGMVNGYFDLGNFHGVTPFVGGGVGVAYNRFYGLSDSTLVLAGNGAASPSGGYINQGSKTNFAWALHAGLAYDVTPNFKVELAYRYMNLGEGRTGAINCYCGETFSPIRVKDIESHDVKLGMRWVLGGPVASVMPAPEPLVRRY